MQLGAFPSHQPVMQRGAEQLQSFSMASPHTSPIASGWAANWRLRASELGKIGNQLHVMVVPEVRVAIMWNPVFWTVFYLDLGLEVLKDRKWWRTRLEFPDPVDQCKIIVVE